MQAKAACLWACKQLVHPTNMNKALSVTYAAEVLSLPVEAVFSEKTSKSPKGRKVDSREGLKTNLTKKDQETF